MASRKEDFKAQRQLEDAYWLKSALRAEARARRLHEKPIPLEEVERAIDECAKRRTKREHHC